MVLKRHLTPLSKGGKITTHKGKGSMSAPMPARSEINSLATPPGNSVNNYAKASPMGEQPQGGGGGDYGG